MPITISDINSIMPLDYSVLPYELVQKYIDIVTEVADLELNNIFPNPLPTIAESDCINYGTENTFGSNFISIGAWQETGLTIKQTTKDKQHDNVLSENPLTIGKDYTFWYGKTGKKIPGKTLPVTAVKLTCGLQKYEILRVSGTYGWATTYPADIKTILSNVVISLATYANNTSLNGGVSGLSRIRDMTTEIEMSEDMAKQLRDQARNFLLDPAYSDIITSYKYATEQTISII
jgi:hypothetical protein